MAVWFHVDLDAFYAAVEQHDAPQYRNKPVIIGARPGTRGVVSACSYEARVYGVRSAMPISEAYRRCPQGIYLPVRMERYQEVSKSVMELFSAYTPRVQQISVDEAFLELTGTERLFGDPEDTAKRIKTEVLEKTGLTLSIGIAANRYVAKLASEFGKPDGLHRVPVGRESEFINKLALKDLWGVGKKTLERLYELNITSVARLRSFSEALLQSMLGDGAGSFLYYACRGEDPGIFQEQPKSHSLSNEVTFEEDVKDRETIKRVLLELSHQIMFRLIGECSKSRTVFLKIRYSDFTTTTVQKTLRHYLCSAEEFFTVAVELLGKRWDGFSPIRLIGAGVSTVESTKTPEQPELFEQEYDKKKKVEEAVLKIRMKMSRNSIIKATLLEKKDRGPNPEE